MSDFVHSKKVAWAIAPIKNSEALENIAQTESVLDLLTPSSKRRFIDSLVFRDNGIAGFYYGDLEAELTPTQIYQVLSLVGAQHTVYRFNKARIESETDVLLLSPPKKFGTHLLAQDKEIVSPMIFADHKGYRCDSRATCKKDHDVICMSSC